MKFTAESKKYSRLSTLTAYRRYPPHQALRRREAARGHCRSGSDATALPRLRRINGPARSRRKATSSRIAPVAAHRTWHCNNTHNPISRKKPRAPTASSSSTRAKSMRTASLPPSLPTRISSAPSASTAPLPAPLPLTCHWPRPTWS